MTDQQAKILDVFFTEVMDSSACLVCGGKGVITHPAMPLTDMLCIACGGAGHQTKVYDLQPPSFFLDGMEGDLVNQ